MRTRTLLVIAATSCLVACGEKAPVEETRVEAPVEETPVVEETAPAEEVAVVDESMPDELVFDQAFVDHMHVHAERIDELMFALADGDLEAAAAPAAWLARHPADESIPEEWHQYLDGMREAASAVADATDLETARTAAENISASCQECHAAAGINATD